MTGKIMRAALMSANWTVPTTTRILDEFTDTNGTALASHVIAPTNINMGARTWRKIVGAAVTIQSNRAFMAGNMATSGRYVLHHGEPNVVVKATCNLSNDTGSAMPQVIVRANDANNFIQVRYAGGAFTIYEFIEGAYTLKGTDAFTADPNTDHVIQVTCNGTTITATLDGAHSLSYTCAAALQYACGYGILPATFDANTVQYDDFTVTPIATPETLWLADSPDINQSTDELVVHAIVSGVVYGGANLNTGRFIKYSGGSISTFDTQAGRSTGAAVYDGSKIYIGGIGNDAGAVSRAAIYVVDPTNDSVVKTFLNATGKATGTCNNLERGMLNDGTQIVAGEIPAGTGASTTGSDYVNSGGLWTMPKATIDDASTFTRVYEDPLGLGYTSIAKRATKYFAYLCNFSNGKYYIRSSTDLTTWSTEVDGTAIAGRDIRGSLCYHPGTDLIVAFTPNATRDIVLRTYNGTSWATQTTTLPKIPDIDTYHGLWAFVVDSTRVALIVGHGWDGALDDAHHDLYVFSNLTTTPTYTPIRTSVVGTFGFGQAFMNGGKLTYGIQYPGKLIQQAV